MTTPQSELYRLSERIHRLTDLFESDENGDNVFYTIKQIELQQLDLINSQQRLENIMNLVVQLLQK